MKYYVLGLDPALANFGWCLVELMPDSERPVACGTVKTERDIRKGELAALDDLRRVDVILEAFDLDSPDSPFAAAVARDLDLERIRPLSSLTRIVAMCVELPAGGKGARAFESMGMGKASISAITRQLKCARAITTPLRLKKAVTGRKGASKADVRAALEQRYPGVVDIWPRTKGGKVLKGETEHAADALGAFVACRGSEAIMTARRMM